MNRNCIAVGQCIDKFGTIFKHSHVVPVLINFREESPYLFGLVVCAPHIFCRETKSSYSDVFKDKLFLTASSGG